MLRSDLFKEREENLMKKVIVLLIASILVIGLLSGCGGNETKNSTTDDDSNMSNKAKVTLWYYWENKDHQEILASIIKDFNDSQKKIEVAAEYVPFTDFKKQLSIGVAANKLPDIAIIDNPDHAAYARMGLFADITDKIKDWPDKDQYFEGPWKSCTLDGKVYGIPFGSNCLALFYNEDMLTKANVEVPTTWDELKVAAKKLTGDGVTGIAISAPKNEEGTFQFMPWLLSTGAEIDKINSPEAIKAFDYLAGLVEDGSMSKEVINWTQGDVLKQFQASKTAMMINGPWQIPTLKEDSPDLKWNVSLAPKDKEYASVLGGENWGVINGDKVDESLEFLMYAVSSHKVKEYIGKFGYLPSRRDVAIDKQFTDDPIMKVFTEEMQYARPRGPHPKWPEVSNAISTALQETLTLTKSPEEAAKKCQEKIDKIENE